MREYHVYIMSNRSRTLYTGVTSNLAQRVYTHKQKSVPGFTSKYNITRLVYAEATDDVNAAIHREKQIKGRLRAKKIALIESLNPEWDDLSETWFAPAKILRCAQDDSSSQRPTANRQQLALKRVLPGERKAVQLEETAAQQGIEEEPRYVLRDGSAR
jgi:putative endonuclease